MDKPTTRVLKRTSQPLPCKLTEAEFRDRAKRLADTQEDIANEMVSQEDQKRAMKAKIAALEAERSRLAIVVSRSQETRDVECEDVADDARGKAIRYRLDTGEVTHERPLTEFELQVTLPIE